MSPMADGMLRTSTYSKKGTARTGGDVAVQVDESDLDMLQQGTLRILRVQAKTRLDTTPGAYKELEVNGESLPIVDIDVDGKRGVAALVTVG